MAFEKPGLMHSWLLPLLLVQSILAVVTTIPIKRNLNTHFLFSCRGSLYTRAASFLCPRTTWDRPCAGQHGQRRSPGSLCLPSCIPRKEDASAGRLFSLSATGHRSPWRPRRRERGLCSIEYALCRRPARVRRSLGSRDTGTVSEGFLASQSPHQSSVSISRTS